MIMDGISTVSCTAHTTCTAAKAACAVREATRRALHPESNHRPGKAMVVAGQHHHGWQVHTVSSWLGRFCKHTHEHIPGKVHECASSQAPCSAWVTHIGRGSGSAAPTCPPNKWLRFERPHETAAAHPSATVRSWSNKLICSRRAYPAPCCCSALHALLPPPCNSQ
jgi:hypothetical protein